MSEPKVSVSAIRISGNFTIIGQDGGSVETDDRNHTVIGGLGNNSIYAGSGDDFISGGTGNNTIHGGAGHDRIYVRGEGSNEVTGGEGDDTIFVAHGTTVNINDFGDGDDVIVVHDIPLEELDRIRGILSSSAENIPAIMDALRNKITLSGTGGDNPFHGLSFELRDNDLYISKPSNERL